MSERKVLNKYYPPDFDPSKIPRARCPKNRQFTVRLMAPCNMKCLTCGEYIAKGKKFNSRKEDVENQTYLGIRIYRFYIKCPGCLSEISFRTDPESTDYVIEAGAHRNFQALKRAEEQAAREEQEAKEEIESNPMLLLENRTQQSQHEMEVLESLEDLRELNERHAGLDLTEMAHKYEVDRQMTQEQVEEAEKMHALMALGYEMIEGELVKRVADDELDDISVPTKKQKIASTDQVSHSLISDFPELKKKSFKSKFTGIVKVKRPSQIPEVYISSTISDIPKDTANSSESKIKSSESDINEAKSDPNTNRGDITKDKENQVKNCGLSLLATYSDSSSEYNSD